MVQVTHFHRRTGGTRGRWIDENGGAREGRRFRKEREGTRYRRRSESFCAEVPYRERFNCASSINLGATVFVTRGNPPLSDRKAAIRAASIRGARTTTKIRGIGPTEPVPPIFELDSTGQLLHGTIIYNGTRARRFSAVGLTVCLDCGGRRRDWVR